jgi:FHA domain
MVDPRLNSLHLDPVRRQDYRRARDHLLHSRGDHTLYAERQGGPDTDVSSTFIRKQAAGAPADLKYWLVDKEFIYLLKVGVNTLGRSGDNDVVVEDAYVSRRHCAILVHLHRGCELHDTASKNGTYVNGAKLAGPTLLKSGDEIRVCERQFLFLAKSDVPDNAHVTHTLAE